MFVEGSKEQTQEMTGEEPLMGLLEELPHSSPIFILMSCWYLALERFRSLKNAEVQLNMSKALSICSEQAVLYQILNKIFFQSRLQLVPSH